MKKLFTILFILLCKFSFTQKIYISPTGNDGTGNGTSGNPYATFFKAASVAVSPDTIYVNAGTYSETQEAIIAAGVNVDGAGQGIAIVNNTLNSSGHYAIRLASGSEGTNGNQFIRNITLTGSSVTGLQGIYVLMRSNVIIYNCTISNFVQCGVYFEGQSSYGNQPGTYATGNKLYNDSLVNCSTRDGGGAGMIGMGGQDGLQIYNNYLNQTARATGHNGNILYAVEGYNKNVKFYNNKSIKPDVDGATNWNFHIESWSSQGGMEAYNNTFAGGVALDIGYYFANPGTSTYSWSFHNNYDTLSAQQASTSRVSQGVNLETFGSDLYIYGNHFKNLANPIEIEGNPNQGTFDSIFVYNNLFDNSGYSDNTFTQNILIYATKKDTMTNIFIDNNTFSTATPATLACHVSMQSDSFAVASNIYFRNNIAVNSSSSSGFFRFRAHPGIMNGFYLNNNIIYNNGNSNNLYYDNADPVTNVSVIKSIVQNPLLNSDYTLQAGSPALGTELNIGFPTCNIGYWGLITSICNYIIFYGNWKFL